MERIYLLLRNNRQSGPFTIGELLQHQVMPSDMIWVEGKSTAWTYISELELTPFVKKTEANDQPRNVNGPDEIERKAEELRQKILANAPKNHFQNHSTEIETYASPHRSDDEIQFIDYRKERKLKKSTAVAELLLTGLVIGLIVVGIYKSKSFFGARHDDNSVATELKSDDQHAAQKINEPKQVLIVPTVVVDSTKKTDSLLALQRTKQKFLADRKAIVDSAKAARKRAANQQGENEIAIQKFRISSDSLNKEEDAPVKREIITSVPEIKATSEPVKEKKGFLKGLFKKKKEKGD